MKASDRAAGIGGEVLGVSGRLEGGALKRTILFHADILGFVLLLGTMGAIAQPNSYQQTNLVSDMAGGGAHTDPRLINPWGIAFVPGQPEPRLLRIAVFPAKYRNKG